MRAGRPGQVQGPAEVIDLGFFREISTPLPCRSWLPQAKSALPTIATTAPADRIPHATKPTTWTPAPPLPASQFVPGDESNTARWLLALVYPSSCRTGAEAEYTLPRTTREFTSGSTRFPTSFQPTTRSARSA